MCTLHINFNFKNINNAQLVSRDTKGNRFHIHIALILVFIINNNNNYENTKKKKYQRATVITD